MAVFALAGAGRCGALRDAAAAGSPLARAGLALILGGAAGNLLDRRGRGTSWTSSTSTGVAGTSGVQLADAAITVGVAILIVDLLRPASAGAPAA